MICPYCEHRCDLGSGKGICGMFYEKNGKVEQLFAHQWSTYSASRVESVPFYHAYPGSRSMIIGSAGCNFRCKYCSNAFIACQDPAQLKDDFYDFSPKNLVKMAQKLGCHNIVFNVNEPTVSLPSLMAVKQTAQKAGIPMGCLTNGYTTPEATGILAQIFSFVHIGLKGFSDQFYQKYVGVPSVAPVLRNIETFAKQCHVEIASPIIQNVNDHEFTDISGFIKDINPQIPWHVFRLLPEHMMKNAQYPDIQAMNQALETARDQLAYVYFHNFVGSDWVNTLCPSCKHTVIKRFSLGCSGDRLDEFLAPDNLCPVCNEPIGLLGTRVPWNANQKKKPPETCPQKGPETKNPKKDRQKTGGLVIIDAREWQNQFDLETGARTEKTHGLAPMVKKILADHPYPGDTDPLANTWVTQTAMDLIQNYDPSLVCLSYVQQFFTIRHLDLSFQNIHDLLSAAMDEALSFVKDSGYTPIIVGTGPMIPLSGVMDLSGLKGLAIASKWSCRYCGIHDPGPGDLDFLKGLNGMERLVTRDQWISMFKKSQPDLDLPTDIHLMPEVLAVAKEGFAW
ncbi:MAG: radical SAM protein [Desulfobacter sp.]|nr:MAG: radical SAM protein [Desulfobacter sp.]